MATLISIERIRRQRRADDGAAREEAVWRNSMLPSAMAMGVIIVLATGALVIGTEKSVFGEESMAWILIAALVSVFALTKIVIANLLFFVLASEKPRPAVAGRGPRPTNRAVVPLRVQSPTGLPHQTANSRDEQVLAASNE